MAWVSDEILDQGLDWADTNATRLDVCSQEPTTYAEAATTYTLGNKGTVASAAPADRGAGGREVVISAITDGTVTDSGTATHWALTNGSDTLVATGSLSASQAVTSGNTFTLAAFAVGIPDAAA